ncbi:MAG: DUF1622 domain-containing protein [Hyphomicrobiaceae bacterium]
MKEYFAIAVLAFESVAIVVLILGTLSWMAICAGRLLRGAEAHEVYRAFRRGLGKTILVALDIMLAADVILTATLDFSLDSLAAVGLLVLIRTFLHFVLELELTGRWPWQEPRDGEGFARD